MPDAAHGPREDHTRGSGKGESAPFSKHYNRGSKALEPSRRGLYAGAVGYLDFAGNLDFCIAIRTLLVIGSKAYLQAGAGIVADSNPSAEYQETRDKARALVQALELAQAGL